MPKIRLTGDTTISGIARALQKKLAAAGAGWEVSESGFNSWLQDVMDPKALQGEDFVGFILSPRFLTDAPEPEALIDQFLSALERSNGAYRALCTTLAVDPWLPQPLYHGLQKQELADRINLRLGEFSRSHPWFQLFHMPGFFAEHGLPALHDPRFEMVGRMFFSPGGANLLGDRLARCFTALTRAPAKVLALDLDNTLWGGVIGEDGISGIKIGGEGAGYAYSRFQRSVLELKKTGVILVMCSKNNEADALKVFAEHPDMVLKAEDFAAHRINWLPKAENLKSMAEELNLGIDSFVFMDDSSFEREHVRQALPSVQVIDTPADASEYTRALSAFRGFDAFRVTEEDRARSQQYSDERQRTLLKGQSASLDDFYKSLQMKVTIGKADGASFARVHQLIWKTNQFNLTTRRYEETELKKMLESKDWEILTLRLQDKFGESGLTGVAVIRKRADEWVLENFLMSCRIIGRTVEYAFMKVIAKRAAASGAKRLRAAFIPSAKNKVAENYLPSAGFTRTDTGEWVLETTGTAIPRFFASIEEA